MKESIESNPCWERLQQVINYSGLSANSFAKAIGLKRSENLYQIKRGKNRISLELARRIHACYPEYSMGWLLTGEESDSAEPFPELDANCSCNTSGIASGLYIAAIPFYRSLAGRDINKPMIPDCCLHLSECLCNGALLATVYRGSHLYPLLPKNCIVLLKPCEPDEITDGNLYYIETRCLRVFRIVHCSEDSSRLTLTTPQGDNELEVEKKEVLTCMQVAGVISILTR